ncbi:unnamed protein product [Arctogadus glacialis]
MDSFSGSVPRVAAGALTQQEQGGATAMATSLSRATSFNKTNVEFFFSRLGVAIEKSCFDGSDIWNMDETGVTTVQAPSREIVLTQLRLSCRQAPHLLTFARLLTCSPSPGSSPAHLRQAPHLLTFARLLTCSPSPGSTPASSPAARLLTCSPAARLCSSSRDAELWVHLRTFQSNNNSAISESRPKKRNKHGKNTLVSVYRGCDIQDP